MTDKQIAARIAELECSLPEWVFIEFEPVPAIPAIYAIEHRGGRRYVGITSNLQHRLHNHVSAHRRGRGHLQAEWDQDGPDAFTLTFLDDDVTFEREMFWIKSTPIDQCCNFVPELDAEAEFVRRNRESTTGRLLEAAVDRFKKSGVKSDSWVGMDWPLIPLRGLYCIARTELLRWASEQWRHVGC